MCVGVGVNVCVCVCVSIYLHGFTKVKHADFTDIYKDDKNRKYLQKLLKHQAEWLG